MILECKHARIVGRTIKKSRISNGSVVRTEVNILRRMIFGGVV